MHSYHGTTPAQIVARRKNIPRNLSGKTRGHRQAAPRFYDAAHWNELAAKHLPRYDLPAWGVPCDMEAMRRWLERIGLSEKRYEKLTATSLGEFIELNPSWPLRAWIGLSLELNEDGAQADL